MKSDMAYKYIRRFVLQETGKGSARSSSFNLNIARWNGDIHGGEGSFVLRTIVMITECQVRSSR